MRRAVTKALSPQLSIWLRVEDDLSSALLDAERSAATAIAEHARRVLGPPGLPLPADTFADLWPGHMGRHERRALAQRDLNRPPEAPTTLDLEALWPAMLARFPSKEAAHDTARADLALRFCDTFFGRRYPAPEPHRDGIKLYAAHEAYSWSDPKYCFDSATRLLDGLDAIRAIPGEAGITVPVGQLHAWQRAPLLPTSAARCGPRAGALSQGLLVELQMGRDLARALNLLLAAYPGPSAATA